MKSFTISRFQAGLVQSAFYMGYFILAIPAGMIMKKYSYKVGILVGLFLFSLGSILFYPAAIIGRYEFFLIALFIIASGLSFLETGANPFIAGLGSPETAAQRLNFSQSFNPVGAIIGVIIGTTFIFSGIEHSEKTIEAMKLMGTYDAYLRKETIRVVAPYVLLGIIVLIWAILILFTKFPDLKAPNNEAETKKGSFKKLFKTPHFLKGVMAQFCYVGAQVGTWSFFMQYIQDYTGKGEKFAGLLLTGTLIVFGIGRFFSTFLMKKIKPEKLMGLYSSINFILILICIIIPSWIGVGAIFLTSFFMSLMFPTIFALSIDGLEENTKLGGSILVMAIIGGAVFNPIMGIISDSLSSMAMGMIVPLFCYLVVLWFSYNRLSQNKKTIEKIH